MFRAVAHRTAALRPRTTVQSITLARRHISDEHRTAIQKAITTTPVVLFMKGTLDAPACGFSKAVVQMMDFHGVPKEKMKGFNVLADDELRSGIKEFSQWPTVPQVYMNGEFVGGCDIMMNMHQSGELEDLLIENGIIPELIPDKDAAPSS